MTHSLLGFATHEGRSGDVAAPGAAADHEGVGAAGRGVEELFAGALDGVGGDGAGEGVVARGGVAHEGRELLVVWGEDVDAAEGEGEV